MEMLRVTAIKPTNTDPNAPRVRVLNGKQTVVGHTYGAWYYTAREVEPGRRLEVQA